MKNNFIAAILALASFVSVNAQEQPVSPTPIAPIVDVPIPPAPMPTQEQHPEFVQFKEVVFNFDTIKQGVPASHIFEFKNVGSRDITLDNVQASCGCTTPNWKAGAYKAGETGQINATYNAGSEGYFEKTITVVSSEGTTMLTIKGWVISAATYDTWKIAKDERDAAKGKKTSTKAAKVKTTTTKKSN